MKKRKRYDLPDGRQYSEVTRTFPIQGPMGEIWYTFPSVDEVGDIMPEWQVRSHVARHGPVDPITNERFPQFQTREEAERYARQRSRQK